MDLKILPDGRRVSDGSQTKDSYSVDDKPLTELFVREVIQNSLDAYEKNDLGLPVEIDFVINTFDTQKFSKKLPEISDSLERYYGADSRNYRPTFIAVRDVNTIGLSGYAGYEKDPTLPRSNFEALVFDKSNAQNKEGAGGSKGLGKTLYFNLGVGIVIYYSHTEGANGLEHRLIIELSELHKDTNKRRLLNGYDNYIGTAWWGEETHDNFYPITNLEQITEFLKIFGMEPFNSYEKGTTVIIPYIEKGGMLHSNTFNTKEKYDLNDAPFHLNDLESVLELNIKKWYFPRLDNTDYPYEIYFTCTINGKKIEVNRVDFPHFKIFQDLYKMSQDTRYANTLLKEATYDVQKFEINSRNYLVNKVPMGNLVVAKIPKTYFKEDAPFDNYDLFKMLDLTENNGMNYPVLVYTRNSGMILEYVIGLQGDNWIRNSPKVDNHHYVLAFFVPNSDAVLESNITNRLAQESIQATTLNDYLRSTETETHNKWIDSHTRIVSHIKTEVSKIIANQFKTEVVEFEENRNELITKAMSQLLPNHGKKQKTKLTASRKTTRTKTKVVSKRPRVVLDFESTEYRTGEIAIPFCMENCQSRTVVDFELFVTIGSNRESLEAFEQDFGFASGMSLSRDVQGEDLVILNSSKTIFGDTYKLRLQFNGESEANKQGVISISYTNSEFIPLLTANIVETGGN